MPAALVATHAARLRFWIALALAALATFSAFVPTTHAAGAKFPNPVSGTSRWAILLCTFADHPQNPVDMQPPASFFEDLFTETGAGKGGMFDYWKTMSYGQLDLTGSRVFGWFQQTQTLADHRLLGGANPAGRHEKMQACIDAASADPSFPASTVASDFYGIVAIWNDGEDTWGGGPQSYNIAGGSHTFGT